mmetsp:Transcript_24559/g.34285  ORF Transcript_24559/g.34285 Transcript_24559/m.34285 type:complete len:80 (+) Transcript_24559:481-720(+)
MHYILSNISLNSACLGNNLAILLVTLIRYKLVSKPTQENTVVFSVPILVAMIVVWKTMSCFLGTNDGEMASSFFSLVLD